VIAVLDGFVANGKARVADEFRRECANWFLDSPIPSDVRAQVDGVLRNAYGEMVDELKDALNELDNSSVSPELSMLVKNIRAFSGAVEELSDVVMPYVDMRRRGSGSGSCRSWGRRWIFASVTAPPP